MQTENGFKVVKGVARVETWRQSRRPMAFVECGFFAETLGVSTRMNVLLPEADAAGRIGLGGAQRRERYPVLYLLHGWSDDESIWSRRTSIERYAATHGIVVVMPRVELSYYQNMATGMRFWDFLSEELPRHVQHWFPVSDRREDTFAAGLSMGGYGAFRLALAHPERYAAAASLSGALDIREAASSILRPGRDAQMQAIFGQESELLTDEVDLFALSLRPTATQPRLWQCCGTEDFLYASNLRFRDHAKNNGLNLTYSEGPGEHSWDYWDAQIQHALAWLLIK